MPIGPKVKALIGAMGATKQAELVARLGVPNVDAIEPSHFEQIKSYCTSERDRIKGTFPDERPLRATATDPFVPVTNPRHRRHDRYNREVEPFETIINRIDTEHRADQAANSGALADDQNRNQNAQLLAEQDRLENELSVFRKARGQDRDNQFTELRNMIQRRFTGIFQTDNWAALFMFILMLFPDSYDKVLKKLYAEIQRTYEEGLDEKDTRAKLSQLVQQLAEYGEGEIRPVDLDRLIPDDPAGTPPSPFPSPLPAPTPSDRELMREILEHSGLASSASPAPSPPPIPVP